MITSQQLSTSSMKTDIKPLPIIQSKEFYNIVYTISPGVKKHLVEHKKQDFHNQKTISKGRAGRINGKIYALFRDNQESLWLLGEDIENVLITPEITVCHEGKNQHLLSLYKKNSLIWQTEYFPDEPSGAFTAAIMDESRDDFGLYIYEILSDDYKRRHLWTDAWHESPTPWHME